ncbi:MAG TPA: hypothetical protein VNY33_04325, partial [Gaiellaceae bacterium]|nr:hypothetical protein [Gaiellaceae bacterium]
DALLALLQSSGVPIRDPRNRVTTPRIDLAAALGIVLGHPIAVPPSAPAAPAPMATPILSKPTVPRADVSVRPIAFGSIGLTKTATRTLVIRNSGTGYLTVRVATSLAAVSAEPAKLVIPASKRGTLVLTFRPDRAGVFRGQLRLETDDPNAVRITVAVRGTGRS